MIPPAIKYEDLHITCGDRVWCGLQSEHLLYMGFDEREMYYMLTRYGVIVDMSYDAYDHRYLFPFPDEP